MANTPHVPTPTSRQQVQAMAGYGIDQEKIAAIIGICDKTLRKHYRNELDLGLDKANSLVAQALFQNATANNNVTAQIFWMKTRAGWREKVDHTHAGPDGGRRFHDRKARLVGRPCRALP